MLRPRRVAWTSYVVLGAVALLASCSGETPTDSGGEPVDQEPQFDALRHLISDPVPSLTGAAGASASVVDVSYVSLPPGTYPEGETATISNQANGANVNATFVEGGFDPVPVPSAVGDTLFITIKDLQGEIIGLERATVPPEAPPLIVRTRPTKSKIFVPLNLVAAVVFSEPVDRSTVTPQTIQIRLGGVDGAEVAGTVALRADGILAEFTATVPLEPGTEYALVVTTGIRDVSGDALANQEVVNFETLGIVAYVVVDGGCACTNGDDYVAVIDTKTHGLVDTTAFGPQWRTWWDILFIPNRPVAYLRGLNWQTTVVIDAGTHDVVRPVAGVIGLGRMTASEDGRFVYGVNSSREVAVVSTDIHETVATISAVDGRAFVQREGQLAPSPDGSVVYAVAVRVQDTYDPASAYSINVIDAATRTVVATIPLPGPIGGVQFSPDGSLAYASWFGDDSSLRAELSRIYMIDTSDHTLVTTLDLGVWATDAVMTLDGTHLLLSTPPTGIAVVETATMTVVGQIDGVSPTTMLVSPDGSHLYAAQPKTIWVIDLASMSVVTGIPVEAAGDPYVLAATPDGAFVYVANAGANTVVVIDTATNTVVAEIDVGGRGIKDMAIGPR